MIMGEARSRRRKSRSVARRPLAAFALLMSLLTARAVAGEGDEPAADTRATVRVRSPRPGTLPLTIHSLGRIVAMRETPSVVQARSAGPVAEIVVRDGARVRKGDPLIKMDARAASATLKKARSSLALAQAEELHADEWGIAEERTQLQIAAKAAKTKAAQAGLERDRLAALLEKQLVSEKAASEALQSAAEAAREGAAADAKVASFDASGRSLERGRLRDKIEEAKAAVQLAEIEAEAVLVKAPVSGRVARVAVSVGQAVDAGGSLVELVADEGVGVVFALAPAQARQIHPSSRLDLCDSATTATLHGSVLAIAGAVEPETGLIRVQGVLDAAPEPLPALGEYLPGELVRGESPPGFIVPVSALGIGDNGWFVHLVDEGGRARQTPVRVLARSMGEAAILGTGITAGARVIIDGNYNLPDGSMVIAKEAP